MATGTEVMPWIAGGMAFVFAGRLTLATFASRWRSNLYRRAIDVTAFYPNRFFDLQNTPRPWYVRIDDWMRKVL